MCTYTDMMIFCFGIIKINVEKSFVKANYHIFSVGSTYFTVHIHCFRVNLYSYLEAKLLPFSLVIFISGLLSSLGKFVLKCVEQVCDHVLFLCKQMQMRWIGCNLLGTNIGIRTIDITNLKLRMYVLLSTYYSLDYIVLAPALSVHCLPVSTFSLSGAQTWMCDDFIIRSIRNCLIQKLHMLFMFTELMVLQTMSYLTVIIWASSNESLMDLCLHLAVSLTSVF